MTIPVLAVHADLGEYARHVPAITELLGTLPAVQHYTTFPGGAVFKLNPEHYVAVMLPPVSVAEGNFRRYLDDHFDGPWDLTTIEYFGQIEAWHMTPPWA